MVGCSKVLLGGVFGILLVAGGAQAAPICTSVKVPVGQQEVDLPLKGNIDTSDPSKPFPFALTLNIEPVTSNIDAIVRAAGLDQSLGDRHASYNGTLAAVEGERLRVKVHLRYRRGFLIDTRGSVEAYFHAATDGRSLSLAADSVSLNVSADVLKELVKAAHLDDRVETAVMDWLAAFLSSPEAVLQLPEALQGTDLRLTGAQFTTQDGHPALTVSGTAPASPALFAVVLKTLGNC